MRYSDRCEIQTRIEEKLGAALSPCAPSSSRTRATCTPSRPESETHFKVLVVSEAFDGMNRVARQRKVNETLRDELAGGVHALTMRTLTPSEMGRRRRGWIRVPEVAMAARKPTQSSHEERVNTRAWRSVLQFVAQGRANRDRRA